MPTKAKLHHHFPTLRNECCVSVKLKINVLLTKLFVAVLTAKEAVLTPATQINSKEQNRIMANIDSSG